MVITRRQLMRVIDKERIKQAIIDAEHRTSGEICVSVAPFFWGSIEKAARKTFDRLGMSHTRERNGVLFFVVPARRKFVVLGDSGIHDHVGQEFWHRVVDVVAEQFRSGKFTEGIVKGIAEVADRLAEHFPYDAATDVDELPDDVDFGG